MAREVEPREIDATREIISAEDSQVQVPKAREVFPREVEAVREVQEEASQVQMPREVLQEDGQASTVRRQVCKDVG